MTAGGRCGYHCVLNSPSTHLGLNRSWIPHTEGIVVFNPACWALYLRSMPDNGDKVDGIVIGK